MKVRVLGCSGAIARECRTTSFLIDDDVLVDAGTGVGDLSLEEMAGIGDVLLSHSHLDHVAALPLMIDTIASQLTEPVRIHALAGTIAALRAHIFNDVIWPDFSRIPTPANPFVTFHELKVGQTLEIKGKSIEVLPAVHTVPAVGFSVAAGKGCWVFTGDTERNPAFWERINHMNVAALVIETAFSNRELDLARRSLHLSPVSLAEELDCIDKDQRFPIYITHTKPAETDLIMREIQKFDQTQPCGRHVAHDIRWLRAGQVFDL
ncbi:MULTISPECIES: 3',5'-cyclic-nucleotide phosphodiesterase [Ramlibacter]|uniref:3',5'-cyclic-nucleotide phosphodiesterase n=1 Tax=Ramlibacter aquaticus TaxID=2780094 RepID=A0ABR9SCE1_9BURK|nr:MULTISPECIES: 3',5'-cyclic-nucleotide phosphodiesterase [Ramlibacter]MBE7939437.1 3',5'-cyclic-nucleotide phosphodiesterase [Ramlibacter aquaticus]